MYTPCPIDVTQVRLPDDLAGLIEQLAENVHDSWARQRMGEGWVYGPQRNDAAKTHPCLVPYSELSESEREYDRISAMNTLKAIMALGYRIVEK